MPELTGIGRVLVQMSSQLKRPVQKKTVEGQSSGALGWATEVGSGRVEEGRVEK